MAAGGDEKTDQTKAPQPESTGNVKSEQTADRPERKEGHHHHHAHERGERGERRGGGGERGGRGRGRFGEGGRGRGRGGRGRGGFQERHDRGQQGGFQGGRQNFMGEQGQEFQQDEPDKPKEEKKFTGRCRLFVGNIQDMEEEDFKKMFEGFGEISEVYLNKQRGFGFIRLDTRHNAEAAKDALDGTTRKGRTLRVRFATHGAALRVRHLVPSISNELLEEAFSKFGQVERAIVIVDDRGRSTGEGIVEFARKPGAQKALGAVTDGCFLLTSQPKPCIVEPLEQRDEDDGLPEKYIQKNAQYHKDREMGYRFASPGSFEFKFAQRWKQLYEMEVKEKERLQKEMEDAEEKLEMEMVNAMHEFQANKLREELRRLEELRLQEDMKRHEMMQRRQEERAREEEEQQRRREMIRQQQEEYSRMQNSRDEMMMQKRGHNDARLREMGREMVGREMGAGREMGGRDISATREMGSTESMGGREGGRREMSGRSGGAEREEQSMNMGNRMGNNMGNTNNMSGAQGTMRQSRFDQPPQAYGTNGGMGNNMGSGMMGSNRDMQRLMDRRPQREDFHDQKRMRRY